MTTVLKSFIDENIQSIESELISLVEKIQAPNLEEIRKLAFVDLDHALLRILEDTLLYLKQNDDVIDPMKQKTYDYYKKGEL